MSSKENSPRYQNILNVETTEVEKYSTGQEWIDKVLDGGYCRGSSIMVSAQAGAGKSTLLQQISDYITSQGGLALYNNVEQSLKQIYHYAQRLDLQSGYIIAQHQHEDDIGAHLISLRDENPDTNIICVVDSVSHMANRSPVRAKAIMSLLCQVAQAFDITVFMILHQTKGGTFAGGNDLLHLIDSYLEMEFVDVEKTLVSAISRKNRYGRANISYSALLVDGKFVEP
jgi:DNA repair protein RadA/Sms